MIRAVSSPVASQFGPGAWPLSVITPIAAVPPEPHRPLYEHRRLLAAVLQQAIDDAAEATEDGERARDWFASDAVNDPFAFAAICDVLDLDARRIRKLIASRVPTRLHQSSMLDVPPREYLPSSGCAVCGWQGVERVCTDPAEHNPCCVRRNPAAATPQGTRAPKPRRLPCARCGGTQDVVRAMIYVGDGRSQYHRICHSCRVSMRQDRPKTTKHTERGLERMAAILGALRNRGGRATIADLRADLPGWQLATLRWRLHRMTHEGKVRMIRNGLYEVLP